MPGPSSFALIAVDGLEEKIVLLVDDEQEAKEIADEMRRAGQHVVIRLYHPPKPGFERPIS
jgi:2',3'-cyclic-nucleotide 2'-phosphodiesterase (5'-nucleotidase family)